MDDFAELQRLVQARQLDALPALATQLLADPGLPPAARAETTYWLARAHYREQSHGAAEERFQQAVELYAECADEENVERARLGLVQLRSKAGLYSEAQFMGGQILAAALRAGWPGLTAEAQLDLGITLNKEHRYREALALLYPAAAYFEAHPAAYQRHESEDTLAWAETGAGELTAGRSRAERLYARLEAEGREAAILAQTLNTLIFNAWCCGDFERQLQLLDQLLALAQTEELPARRQMHLMVVQYNSAVCETQLARFGAAKRRLNRAWDIARRIDDGHIVPAILMLLSLIALHEDRAVDALEYAELARTNSREFQSDESTLIAWYLALARLANGQLDGAAAEWRARLPLEPSIENWIELGWMRRVLGHLVAGEQALAEQAPALELAMRWMEELTSLQSTYPAPPALAITA